MLTCLLYKSVIIHMQQTKNVSVIVFENQTEQTYENTSQRALSSFEPKNVY